MNEPQTIEALLISLPGLEVTKQTVIGIQKGNGARRRWVDLKVTEIKGQRLFEVAWRGGHKTPKSEAEAVALFLEKLEAIK